MNFKQDTLIKSLGIAAGIGLVYGIVANIPFINLVCCCVGWLIMGATGILYGYFADQEGGTFDMGTWVAGGAAAGAVAGLVRGVVNAIALLLLQALGLGVSTAEQLAQLEQAGLDIPPELAGQFAAQGGATVGAALIGICSSFFFYAVLAAIGALIFALIKQGQNRSAPPAV